MLNFTFITDANIQIAFVLSTTPIRLTMAKYEDEQWYNTSSFIRSDDSLWFPIIVVGLLSEIFAILVFFIFFENFT